MLLFNLFEQGIEAVIIFIVVIVLAFAYHEFAHAIVADYLGDPTPRAAGRITLNPLPHLSLPLLVTLLLFGFGGAYTPIRPHLLRGNMRRSHALVAVAGPAANILMAILFALPMRLLDPDILLSNDTLFNFLQQGVFLNVFLALFNLLPIPPLDGFTILQGLVPHELARQMDVARQYGLLILLAIIFFLPRAGVDVFGPLFSAIRQVTNLLIG